MSTFVLEFWIEDDDFCIYAEAGSYEKELTLKGKAEAISAHFDTIYDILEEKKKSKEPELQQAVQTLSSLLITPFVDQLQKCDSVRFIVYEELIHCTFDLLLFNDDALFLQRGICYQIEEGKGEHSPKLSLGTALLIADLTADPEEACKAVSKLIPDSEYYTMEKANVELIKKSADQVDALVISAHGELDDDYNGGISLNDETITASVVGKLEAWLVYFDACGQAINLQFLNAFQNKSEIQFYLAPIISNDAGDSSTKTMVWFFTAMIAHGNPIKALYDTRKRLFAFYRMEKKLSVVESLNKAFPFRLYEFVESE